MGVCFFAAGGLTPRPHSLTSIAGNQNREIAIRATSPFPETTVKTVGLATDQFSFSALQVLTIDHIHYSNSRTVSVYISVYQSD